MWARVERSKADSETAFFYDLLLLGELVLKLCAAGLSALVPDDRERRRYAVEYQLVRANGLGEWSSAISELLNGPVSELLPYGATEIKRELMQKFPHGDSAWQRTALDRLVQVCICLDDQGPGLAARGGLLQWFELFSWLRNRTRGHGATTANQCLDTVLDLETSLRAVTDHLALFQLTWAFLRRNLTGKYRVIQLGSEVTPFEHLKSEVSHKLADGVYLALGDELCRVPFVQTDVDLSDFFVANGNYRLSGFEGLSYLTNDTIDFDSAAYSIPPRDLPASGTSAGPVLDLLGNSFANIPPAPQDYVSRKDLEDEVSDLLLDDRHPVVTLVGRGGVGKTSLALGVLPRIAAAGDYFAVVWFSARDIDLMTHGPKPVTPDVLTFKDMARAFVEWMNPPGSAAKDFDSERFLLDCLAGKDAGGPFLFVFDNFETVRNAVDVYSTIDSYVRLPNKVLITSRFRDFRGDYPVEVRGMSRSEFDSLVIQTCARIGISKPLTGHDLERLYEETDGHPYVVKILLAEMKKTGKSHSVERVMAARDDILDALFERTFSILSPAERRVFLTLCSWRSLVPVLALQAVLLRPGNEERIDVGSAIDSLENSSLIELVGEGESLAIRVPLAAAVFGRKKLTVDSMRPAIEADIEHLQAFGAYQTTGLSTGIKARIHRVVQSLATRRAEGMSIDEDIAVLEFMAAQSPDIWLQLAALHEEAQDELAASRAAAAIKRYLQDHPDDAVAWSKLAELADRSANPIEELHARLRIAELPGASLGDLSKVANRFNGLVARGGLNQFGRDDRRELALRIRRLLEPHAPELNSDALSRLGWICLHLSDSESARRYAEQGLRADPHHSYCRNLKDRLDAEGQSAPTLR